MKKFTLLVIWTAFLCFAGFAQEDMPARASFRNGKLTFETRDRAFRLWFDNRIYVDAAAYLPSEDVSGLMFQAQQGPRVRRRGVPFQQRHVDTAGPVRSQGHAL